MLSNVLTNHVFVSNGSFRSKPSGEHIIWVRETRDGKRRKQFDTNYFRQWIGAHDYDFDTTTRVDHERGGDSRKQVQCVFCWTSTAGESIEMDGETWELGDQKTPRTFIEIDKKCMARVKGWEYEVVYDIIEMKHDGPTLLIKTADGETKRIDTRNLARRPSEE